MISNGSFRLTGFGNDHKYMWQYRKHIDSEGPYLQHVIRPLFKTECNTKFWNFCTRGKRPCETITLADGESIFIDYITRWENDSLKITITWSQTTNGLWCSIKNTTLGKIILSLENNRNEDIFKHIENFDEELDQAVILCHKIANGIQLLQDKMAKGKVNELSGLFPKGNLIQKTASYIGVPDKLACM